MRLSQKNIIVRETSGVNTPADFNKTDFDGSVKYKGYDVIHEKAYLCPCKSRESDHRNTCKNCGGTGWIFANPTKTNMIITGIMLDDKMKEGALREWGLMDMGNVKITAFNEDKLTYMDRITILDATSEHNQILYPVLIDDGSYRFTYTKYDIKGIDFIGLFQSENQKLKRLLEPGDYSYRDNVITLDAQYNNVSDACITIRYIHNPTFHVIELLRESMTSTKDMGREKLIMQVHALGKRAHLIKDVENFDGSRLFDNSWKPSACEPVDMSKFQRQLRYQSVDYIFENMTTQQKADMALLMQSLSGSATSSSLLSGTL